MGDSLGVDFYRAAIAGLGRDIELARLVHDTACTQHNRAAAFADTLGADLTAVVDDAGGNFVIGLRRDNHLPVSRFDNFLVVDQSLHRRRLHQQIRQTVIGINIQRHRIA